MIGVVGLGDPAPGAHVVAGGDLDVPVGRSSAAEVVEHGEVVGVGQVITTQTRQARKLERGEGSPKALSNGASSARSVASETAARGSASRPPRPALGSTCRSERSLVCLPAPDYQVQSIPGARHQRRILMRRLLGHRFLVVSQRSRVSSRLHRTVVEVPRFD